MKHLIQFVKNVKETGAVAPSSRFLAKDLVANLNKKLQHTPDKPVRILELGPGTGVLTKEILSVIRPIDHFDTVELSRYFYCHLLKKYRHENINLINGDFMEYESSQPYDFIFSSLPYETMPEDLVYNIWQKKLSLSKPNAYICYYKYLNFKQFKCDFEKEMVDRYQEDKSLVMLNLPPARCFTLKLNGQHKHKEPAAVIS